MQRCSRAAIRPPTSQFQDARSMEHSHSHSHPHAHSITLSYSNSIRPTLTVHSHFQIKTRQAHTLVSSLPCPTNFIQSVRSMFPPQAITATWRIGLPAASASAQMRPKRGDMSAARATAPAGSTTCLRWTAVSQAACEICGSVTERTSGSTHCRASGHVSSPSGCVRMASAMVCSSASAVDGSTTRAPIAKASPSLFPSGSAAKTRKAGLSERQASEIPEISPPPLVGTTTASRCGHCSISSSPMVPCPAITAGSS
mmetsp:Transcript_11753/g.25535  ORF Transcript_11753/g.25535 Transcript_11753/m.25535 type:complete len:256 (+) Transcript_11753:310-1077(+)